MIRVCHIITQLELGGAQQNTLYTVAHLDRSRFEPMLAAGPGGPLDAEAARCGAPVRFIPALRRRISPIHDAAALADLLRMLRRERPDIVHTHSSKAGILGRWAAGLAGVRHIVHTVHGYGFDHAQRRLAREALIALERVTGRLTTSAFVTVSRANLDQGLAMELFPPERVCLIRSGIRLSDFGPALRDGDRGAVTVGMIACLKPQKAPLDFVRVAARVLRESAARPGPPIRFALVGDGEMRPAVEALIRAEGIGPHVTLAGWRRDVSALIREFDVLLHTSRWEGLPRVFPEAMASGLPIVATRVDGAEEAVEHGVTGYLAAAGDVEELARRTLDLIRDPVTRRRMGDEARLRTGPWDIDQMVRRQERLYEGLMAGAPGIAVRLSTQAGPVE